MVAGAHIQIEDFFISYRDAFNSGDSAAVARHIAAPCLIIERGDTTVWATDEEVLQAITRLVTVYRESGAEQAQFVMEQLLPQGETDAVANVAWTIGGTEGRPIWKFRTGYNLRFNKGAWRIVCCTSYEEAEVRQRTH